MQRVTQSRSRSWLACWLQDRRRKRASAVRLDLWSDGHGRLGFSCNVYASGGLTVCYSEDGVNWDDFYDGMDSSDTSRDESGVAGYFRIARTDLEGLVMLPYSNVVYSDGL